MGFTNNPEPKTHGGVHLIMGRYVLLRKCFVFSSMQNTAVPQGPRKENRGFPEGGLEGFSCIDLFFEIVIVGPKAAQSNPGQPKLRGQKTLKWEDPPSQKLRGRVSGSKTTRKVEIGAGPHLEGSGSVFFVTFPTRKSKTITTYFKNTESWKVPGRKREVSQKTSRKAN